MAQMAEWAKRSDAMMGKIPGLLKLSRNPPLPVSAGRAKGYDMGLVAVLERPEDVPIYAAHPAHQEYDVSMSCIIHFVAFYLIY